MKPANAQQTDDERSEDQPPVDDNDGRVVVSLEEPEPGDDGDDGDEPGSRQQHRSSYRKLHTKWTESETARQRLQEQLEEQSRQLAELRGQVSTIPRQLPQQQQQQQDPDLAEAHHWTQQGQTILGAIRARVLAKQDTADLERQLEDVDMRRQIAVGRYSAKQYHQSVQQQQPNPDALAIKAAHPDLESDPVLQAECQTEALRLMRDRRQPPSLALVMEAISRVKARNGVGQKPPAPTPQQQAKLTGTSGKAGAAGGTSKTMALTKAQQRMAIEYYNGTPHANRPPEQLYEMYARKVLKGEV